MHYRLRPPHKKQLPIDYLAGYLFFLIIVAYVLAFGLIQMSGRFISNFSYDFLLIIPAIWLIDGVKVFFESFSRRSYKSSTENLHLVTVIIACKDGESVIGETLKSLVHRFKADQIIVVSNGSTDDTCHIAMGYNVKVLDIKEPIGKVKAIHAALKYTKTPYVLLLDDDTLVNNAVIPTGLLDEGYDAVAFRVLVKVSNWLSRIQLYEYRKTTDLGRRYHNNKASVQNISGAIGLFKLKQLRYQISRHSGEFSGEDLQRTMLIHLTQDSKGVVLTDSVVYTQPPTTVLGFFNQRAFGWFPGLYANFGNYFKVMTRDKMPFALRFDAFYNIFLVMILDILRLLSLPIIIFYPWYFVVMYSVYVLFELISHYRSGRDDPFWIILIYPLYSMFNFLARVCAFATFIYRRINVKLARKIFLDDYRIVNKYAKYSSLFMTIFLLSFVLLENVENFFIKSILNIGL